MKIMSFNGIKGLKNKTYLMEVDGVVYDLPYTFIGAKCSIKNKRYYHDCSELEVSYIK